MELQYDPLVHGTLPEGYTLVGPPYQQLSGEDCMGNAIVGHWCQDARSPQGGFVSGYGDTAVEATIKALANARWHHAFWSQGPRERLFAHIANAKKQGRFYDKDLVDVIEIFAKRLFPEDSSGCSKMDGCVGGRAGSNAAGNGGVIPPDAGPLAPGLR